MTASTQAAQLRARPAPARTPRGSKGARSSIASPTPIAWIGSPKRSASATSTPPLAVPSSLVITSPLTSAICWKISTWESAFCPVVASSTRSVLCGASGSRFRSTRTIFASSAIRSSRFCSRPAVSISRRSAPSASARASASKARLAGSDPCAAVITGTPARSPQICSCSTAAARKVSPAAITTRLAGGAELARELADRRGLARAVDPDDQHHLRPLPRQRHRPRHRLEDRRDLAGQRLADLPRPDPPPEPPLGDVRRHLQRGVDPHVGLDQQLLEPLEHRVVEHAAPLLAPEQPPDEARPLRLRLRRRRCRLGRDAAGAAAPAPPR